MAPSDVNYPRLLSLAVHALIGAFDTGIGTGSIAVGWMSQRYGFGRAFFVAGSLALLSIPYFLYMEKRQWTTSVSARRG